MIARPVRLQLKRTKGFNLQQLSLATNGLEAVRVARPGKWGNPWHVGAMFVGTDGGAKRYTAEQCVEKFRKWIADKYTAEAIQKVLRGKNLACFCGPRDYCHADVLLEIANA